MIGIFSAIAVNVFDANIFNNLIAIVIIFAIAIITTVNTIV
jgi:hypothetical protein